jgi:hypothetical protein
MLLKWNHSRALRFTPQSGHTIIKPVARGHGATFYSIPCGNFWMCAGEFEGAFAA